MEEYIGELGQLKIRSGLDEVPEQVMIRFLKGLDQSIVEKVDLEPYYSFKDVHKLVVKVEKYCKNKKPYTRSYSHPNPPPKLYSAPKLETQTGRLT